MRRRARWFSSVFSEGAGCTPLGKPSENSQDWPSNCWLSSRRFPWIKEKLVLENRTSNLGWTRVLRWRCVGLEGFVTLKVSWKSMRFPEPGNPTVSSPRAVYSWKPRLIDAMPIGLRRESSSPTPRVQWLRRQFYYLLNDNKCPAGSVRYTR